MLPFPSWAKAPNQASDCAEVPAASKAYDAVRRGRPEVLVRRSHVVAKLVMGDFELNPGKTACEVDTAEWLDEAFNFDMTVYVKAGIRLFETFTG